MAQLLKTTFNTLAEIVDEMELGDRIAFSTEDPEFLEEYNLQPCQYNVICKSKLIYEMNYVIIVGRIDGNSTIAKDISIITNGEVYNKHSRLKGISNFIKEYYENYMPKNKLEAIYLIAQ